MNRNYGNVTATEMELCETPQAAVDRLTLLYDEAIATIERAFRRPVDAIFTSFEREPVASASIAQVHFATLKERSGRVRESLRQIRRGHGP